LLYVIINNHDYSDRVAAALNVHRAREGKMNSDVSETPQTPAYKILNGLYWIGVAIAVIAFANAANQPSNSAHSGLVKFEEHLGAGLGLWMVFVFPFWLLRKWYVHRHNKSNKISG
jgi:hypothetical protein